MSKALAYLICAGLMAALALLPTPLFAQGYESPPTLSAAKVLPPDLLQSPYHKIVGPVTVQGFLNRYQMQTKWGKPVQKRTRNNKRTDPMIVRRRPSKRK